jgi:DNA-binding transcriptional LysR family regulator
MYNITFQQIETFFHVARFLNFSKAADAMFTSQPALSKTLQRFEEGIGIRVFTRGNHGVELTREGAYLFESLEPLYNSLNKVIDTANSISGDSPRTIQIVEPSSYDVSDNYSKFKNIIRRFESAYPDIALSEFLCNFKELRQAIEFGTADIVVAQDFIVEGIPGVSCKRVSRFDFFLAISVEHPLASSDKLDVKALNDEVIYLETSINEEHARELTLERCRRIGFVPKRIEFVPNFYTLYHLIADKRKISICGRFNHIHMNMKIKYFPLAPGERKEYIVAAWIPDRLSPEARNFIKMIPGKEFQQ